MLISADRLVNTPVMSLQTGGQLATTKTTVIDPRSLKVIAFELEGPSLDNNPAFLLINDVRELSNLGLIVDSSEEFVGLADVIKLEEVYNFNFRLDNIQVKDQANHKLGRVISYSVEPESFMVKQLNVKRPLLKSFTDTELLIDRSQVFEVTNDAVTINHDEREPVHVKQAAKSFTNPFRAQHTQAEPTTNLPPNN